MNRFFKYVPFILFLFSVFANLQYPLIWNDEAECIMHSKRVLEYGYPKVHGEKNVIYPIRHPDKKLAIHERTDAYTGIGWGMFYFGTISVKLAEISNNIYFKTWLLRFPFLVMGILGLWIMYRSLSHFLLTKKESNIFLFLLFLMLSLQVDFGLHLREARYYSLMVFFLAVISNTFVRFRVLTDKKWRTYMILQTILLWITYNVFPPIFLIICLFLFIYELIMWKVSGKFKESVLFALPVFVAGVLLIPVMVFFDTFGFSRATADFYQFGFKVYLVHLKSSALYFIRQGNALLIIGMGSVITLLFLRKKIIMRKTEFTLIGLVVVSLIYFFIINTIPHFVFTRYLIPLILIEVLIMSFQVIILYKHFKTGWFFLLVLFIVGSTVWKNKDSLSGRVYELTHQYKGRLDYEIPYLMEKYDQPEKLVIATNYEECSYMYYLGSKVTMGFVLNNLEEDLKVKPDVIIFRKDWGWNYDKWVFEPLYRMGNYKQKTFEVHDTPYNNIPDLHLNDDNHLFKTRLATSEEEKAFIHVLGISPD